MSDRENPALDAVQRCRAQHSPRADAMRSARGCPTCPAGKAGQPCLSAAGGGAAPRASQGRRCDRTPVPASPRRTAPPADPRGRTPQTCAEGAQGAMQARARRGSVAAGAGAAGPHAREAALRRWRSGRIHAPAGFPLLRASAVAQQRCGAAALWRSNGRAGEDRRAGCP